MNNVIEVDVTLDDICDAIISHEEKKDTGRNMQGEYYQRSANCPVALALQRMGYENAYVTGTIAFIDDVQYVSEACSEVVRAFDYGRYYKLQPVKLTFHKN